jgi:hypothetical protein
MADVKRTLKCSVQGRNISFSTILVVFLIFCALLRPQSTNTKEQQFFNKTWKPSFLMNQKEYTYMKIWRKERSDMSKHVDLVVGRIARKPKQVAMYKPVAHCCICVIVATLLSFFTFALFQDCFLGCQLFPSLLFSGAIRYNLVINFLIKSRHYCS